MLRFSKLRFIIWAKLENQISGFIVDRNMNGIHTPVIKNKLSLQTSVTGEILLNDVKIPLENKLNCKTKHIQAFHR